MFGVQSRLNNRRSFIDVIVFIFDIRMEMASFIHVSRVSGNVMQRARHHNLWNLCNLRDIRSSKGLQQFGASLERFNNNNYKISTFSK